METKRKVMILALLPHCHASCHRGVPFKQRHSEKFVAAWQHFYEKQKNCHEAIFQLPDGPICL